jgi:hypothetical protein
MSLRKFLCLGCLERLAHQLHTDSTLSRGLQVPTWLAPKNQIERHRMKTLHRLLIATGAAALLTAGASHTFAQDRNRGNFDPEQFRQRAMERYREQLEVKNDDEWKVISTQIDKVMEARREVGFGFGGPGGFGRGGRGGGGGGAGGGGAGGGGAGGGGAGGGGGGTSTDNGGGDRRSRFGGEPSPEADALQKALEAKAPAEELKAKLAKYREVRKAKEAKLAQAQSDLRALLTVRQEAAAVMGGLLQ